MFQARVPDLESSTRIIQELASLKTIGGGVYDPSPMSLWRFTQASSGLQAMGAANMAFRPRFTPIKMTARHYSTSSEFLSFYTWLHNASHDMPYSESDGTSFPINSSGPSGWQGRLLCVPGVPPQRIGFPNVRPWEVPPYPMTNEGYSNYAEETLRRGEQENPLRVDGFSCSKDRELYRRCAEIFYAKRGSVDSPCYLDTSFGPILGRPVDTTLAAQAVLGAAVGLANLDVSKMHPSEVYTKTGAYLGYMTRFRYQTETTDERGLPKKRPIVYPDLRWHERVVTFPGMAHRFFANRLRFVYACDKVTSVCAYPLGQGPLYGAMSKYPRAIDPTSSEDLMEWCHGWAVCTDVGSHDMNTPPAALEEVCQVIGEHYGAEAQSVALGHLGGSLFYWDERNHRNGYGEIASVPGARLCYGLPSGTPLVSVICHIDGLYAATWVLSMLKGEWLERDEIESAMAHTHPVVRLVFKGENVTMVFADELYARAARYVIRCLKHHFYSIGESDTFLGYMRCVTEDLRVGPGEYVDVFKARKAWSNARAWPIKIPGRVQYHRSLGNFATTVSWSERDRENHAFYLVRRADNRRNPQCDAWFDLVDKGAEANGIAVSDFLSLPAPPKVGPLELSMHAHPDLLRFARSHDLISMSYKLSDRAHPYNVRGANMSNEEVTFRRMAKLQMFQERGYDTLVF